MARLVTTGFEWADTRAEGSGAGVGSAAGASASAARTGSYGCRDVNTWLTDADGVLGRTYYLRFYLRISAIPSTERQIMAATGTGSLHGVRAYVKTDGTVELRDIAGGALATSSALTASTWYRVEIGWMIQSGSGDDYWELRIDGTSIGSSSTASIGTSVHLQVDVNNAAGGSGINVDIDDAALNDDQGASQNSWPGAGNVVLCVPISDSQDGSWRGGAGGTGIDLSLAVDNRPPVGVVSGSATDTSQIESADSSGDNSTDEYRANLTTYTNAGIASGDTISVIQPIIGHGEDIATNTKTGSFGMQSNPSDSYVTFTYGGDIGAIGTWPSNWRNTYGTATYAPSPTLSSSPVLAVRKTDAGTRVASVSNMGLYVDYVPAVSYVPRNPGINFQDPALV